MEANLIQELLLTEFYKEGCIRGSQMAITPDKRRKPDKFSRIEALQPLFERGFVVMSEAERDTPGMAVLIEQLLSIDRGSKVHDDAPDALEGAIYKLNHGSMGDASGMRYFVPPGADRRF